MPVTVNHALSATTPDDPAYEIRPSHWNSAHVAVMSATAGNEIFGAFSNDAAYNVSFSTNGAGQVVASANVTAAPSPVNVTGANGSSVNAQTIAFNNANGMTLGVSTAANGATVTGSYTVPTQTAYVFSNSNGVTFGTNGSTVTASVQTNYLTTAAQSNQVVNSVNGSTGQISLNVGSSLSASTNGSSITFGLASNITTALQSAGAYLTTARASNDAIGLNTAQSNVTWTANSAGLSLDARGYAGTGTSATNASITLNSNGLAISVAAPGGAASQTVYAVGNTTVNSSGTVPLSAVSMRGYGVLSIGTSNGSVLFSTPDAVDFTQFSGGFSTGGNTAGDTGLVTGRLVLAGGANITLSGSTNGGSQTISIVGGAGGGAAVTASANNGSYTVGVLSFSNANGVSFGTSAGSAITASHNGLTSQSNQAASASNGSFTFQTLAFSNANNVTFGTSAGSIITASVAAPGAAAENNNINLLGANTAGNTTASGSTIGWSGQNITLSGTNGSQIVISAPATSSLSATGAVSISTNGSTISIGAPAERTLSGYLEAFIDRELLAAQIGNNQLFVQPMNLRHPAQWEEVAWLNNYSNATNSSNSATLTLQVGVYSRTGNTLSQITSASQSFAVTNSGTVGSYSIYGGMREYAIPMTTTLPAGNYWMGFLSRTTTGGGAGMTWSNFVASNINSAYSGRWSSANNATNQFAMGLGSFNTTTTAIPSSIGLSAINGSAAVNLRPVIYKLVSADLN